MGNILNTYHSIIKNNRSGMVMKNIIASFLLKSWSAVVVLLMVPLTLKCLGAYQNGVWLTVSSLLVWIDQMDIGLGNGLRNSVAIHLAHEDYNKAQQVVSSTVAMLICVVIPIAITLISLLWLTDVYAFLNVDSSAIPELRTALTCAIILVCMTFVMKFIGNVYMGMQLPAVSNLIVSMGQTLALISTWILYVSDLDSFVNIVIANTAAPLVVSFIAYPYTFYVKFPRIKPNISDVSFNVALRLGNFGLKFFWLQIAALIQFFSANILISKFFTPEMVTPYQITYRYMSLMLVAFTVVCMPFWNATTDAYERGDMEWIKKAGARMNQFTLLIAIGLLTMTFVSPWIYRLWIGELCDVPFNMTVVMAIYIFLLIVSMRYSYFLNGIGALRMQIYMTVSAIVFIPIAWLVSTETNNIIWFMTIMCICNVPGIMVNIIQFNKIINDKAKGVWRI